MIEPERHLDVAVVGAGWMGREHAAAIRAAGDNVVAVVDSDIARAGELARSFAAGAPTTTHLTIAEMVKGGRRVAAAVVSSPSGSHLDQIRELVEAGIPVLVEKPPWIVGQDPSPVLELAGVAGVLVAVGMTTRFEPGVRELRQAIRAGELGRVLTVTDEIFFELHDNDLAPWYYSSPAEGGGLILTNGVHAVDRTSWLLGVELRVISAVTQTLDARRKSEDYAAVRLAGTVREGDAVHPVEVQVTLLWSEYDPPISRLQVIGSRGAGWVDGAGSWMVRGLTGERFGERGLAHNNHRDQWMSFRRQVLGTAGSTDEMALATLADLEPTMRALQCALATAAMKSAKIQTPPGSS